MPKAPVVGVTGASGYIGARLCRQLVRRGYRVRAFSRRAITLPGVEHVPYDLRAPLRDGSVDGLAAIVHLAAETVRQADGDIDVELDAARRLIAAARAQAIRIVFVSSQAAHPDAPTPYGRSKWLIEQEMLAKSGIVIKPGLVYGGEERGLYGTLCRTLRTLRIVPVLLPAPEVQPVHVDDLCRALISAIETRQSPPRVFLVAASSMPFHGFLTAVAEHRLDRPTVPVPVPLTVLLPLLDLLKKTTGLGDPGRLRSLALLPRMDTAPSLELLGLQLRPLEAGLQRPRRLQLIEARTLGRYILGSAPTPGFLRRYVRCLGIVDDGRPLRIPRLFRACPALLRLLDQRHVAASSLFSRRLDISCAVGESTRAHVGRFIARGGTVSSLIRVAGLAGQIVVEGAVQVIVLALRAPLARNLPAPVEPRE